MAAVAAFPHLDLALLEDLGSLHIVQQSTIALFVVLFNGGHQAEFGGQLGEAFFLGSFGKAFVLCIGPFVVFALGGVEQVLGGVTQSSQLLEPHFGVFPLVFGGFQEKSGDLLIAFLFGNRGK